MKVLRYAEPPRQPDPLPLETIQHILNYATHGEDDHSRQCLLAACCRISRIWYGAAVAMLYERPVLTNKNFDKFARTLSPPVNSHIPRIGLEKFLRNLDMGGLAYESSKSQTARLLRRVGFALEIFVAPAVNLSISSHTPLSKCHNLRLLDMSRVCRDIDVPHFMKIIRDLSKLSKLITPPYVFPEARRFPVATAEWPSNLEILKFPTGISYEISNFSEVTSTWPPSLHTLIVENQGAPLFLKYSMGFNTLKSAFAAKIHEMEKRLTHITSLRVTLDEFADNRILDNHILDNLLLCCTKVKHLSFPVDKAGKYFSRLAERNLTLWIETVQIIPSSTTGSKAKLLPKHLDPVMVDHWPALWQLRVDPDLVDREDSGYRIPSGFEDIVPKLQEACKRHGHHICEAFVYETYNPEIGPGP